jgi:hypothetical protein
MFAVFGALKNVVVRAASAEAGAAGAGAGAAAGTTAAAPEDDTVVATLTFAQRAEGLQAMEHWHGQELLGRALAVAEVPEEAPKGEAAAGGGAQDGSGAGAAVVVAATGLDAEAAAAMVRAMAAPKHASAAGGGDAAAPDAAAAGAYPPPPPLPLPPPPAAGAGGAAPVVVDPFQAAEAATAAAAAVAAAAAAAKQHARSELDEESAGFRLTGQARVDLMRRLGGGAAADLAPPPPPPPPPQPVIAMMSAAPPSPTAAAEGSLVGPAVVPGPTRCLLLRNLFGSPQEAAAADGPEWSSLLEQDVRDACEQACGGGDVNLGPDHVFVDARGESGGAEEAGGCVYARLPTAEAAAKARALLHGRFYAGRVVAVAYQDEALYAGRFGLAP